MSHAHRLTLLRHQTTLSKQALLSSGLSTFLLDAFTLIAVYHTSSVDEKSPLPGITSLVFAGVVGMVHPL